MISDFTSGCLISIIFCTAFSITDGEVSPIEGELCKAMLENNKCYILDVGTEVFIWFGRVTQVEERKAASQAAEVRYLDATILYSDSFFKRNYDLMTSTVSRNLLPVKIGQSQPV